MPCIPFGNMGIQCILLQRGRASTNTKRIPSGRDLPCINLTTTQEKLEGTYRSGPLQVWRVLWQMLLARFNQ